jgi:hypothetical protein
MKDKFDEDIYMKWQESQNKDFGNFENLSYPYFRHKYKQPSTSERKPSKENPFNNLLPTEYTPNNIDKSTKGYTDKDRDLYYKGTIQTPSDVFWSKQSSERNFYTVPNNSVLVDREKFAYNLYGRPIVCKSGSIYMRQGFPYTIESQSCTGYNAASPENGGQDDNSFVPFYEGAPYEKPYSKIKKLDL